MHEDRLAIGSPLSAESWVGGAGVEIAVDEIGDDFDGALDVELFERLCEEIGGDGGDAVALLDGKARDGEEAAVAADERDVRPVERGDEREAARSGHGASEMRADRMRNGVVDMQKIESFGFEDFEHFGR